jgi:hypothetical protein
MYMTRTCTYTSEPTLASLFTRTHARRRIWFKLHIHQGALIFTLEKMKNTKAERDAKFKYEIHFYKAFFRAIFGTFTSNVFKKC